MVACGGRGAERERKKERKPLSLRYGGVGGGGVVIACAVLVQQRFKKLSDVGLLVIVPCVRVVCL